MTNFTKASAKKVKREIEEILEDMGLLTNCSIFVNDKEYRYPNRELIVPEDEEEDVYLEEINESDIEVIDRKATDCCRTAVDETLSIGYDGGELYSVMNGEFGYTTKEKLMERINEVLKPYDLYLEHCNSWFSTVGYM